MGLEKNEHSLPGINSFGGSHDRVLRQEVSSFRSGETASTCNESSPMFEVSEYSDSLEYAHIALFQSLWLHSFLNYTLMLTNN